MRVQIIIPTIGESITSGVISKWHKSDGEYIAQDEPVLDLETDKVTMPLPSPASGMLTRAAAEGAEVKVGAAVGHVEEAEKPAGPTPKPQLPGAAPAAPGHAPVPQPANGAPSAKATPLAKKTAQDLGVDLSRVTPTGAGGKISSSDVVSAAARPASPAPGRATRERMSPLRQRVAARLVEAQHTAAMLTTFNECDMSGVNALRARYKESFEKKHGVGLGFMSFFIRATVMALRAHPILNAFIVRDEQGQPAIERHESCDIAVAVSSPKGLVVPVVRGAEGLSMAQIEARVKDLAVRARDGKLTLEELQGGTFTITNGGIFGSLMSTPILNPPQSGILGMHAIKNRAVEDPKNPGQVVIRPMMYLALSYDHRLVDGADAVRFLVTLKEAIEDPTRLLLEV